MVIGMRAASILFFFFSSRRRHTRFDCDWSSDVCSSDLSELSITMNNLTNDAHGVNQTKIDNIFQETLLPFDDYREDSDIQSEKSLKKYVHIKTLDEVAFKPVSKENMNEVKNQVTILKKLKDCQNIIHFYGLTSDGGDGYFLVTEWADYGNLREYISSRRQDIDTRLRIRFAYDIAKGLNFLYTVKVNEFKRIFIR